MITRLLIAAAIALAAYAQPARIVSTSPSITETLFALDLGDHVAGVSNYCRYPAAVLALPKVGTYSEPDPEKIALLRPDLVIIHNTAAALAERLTALGIKYAQVKVGSLADVYTMIDDIGRAAGVSERAAKLNHDIRAHLDTLRRGNAKRPKVLVLVGRNPGMLTGLVAAGPSTYLGELLEIAGGQNALADSSVPYPRISLETVLLRDPDVILDSSLMSESSADHTAQEERLRQAWLSHSELTAVKNGTVFGLASEALVTPGPRVVDAVELIRSKLMSATQGGARH